MNASDDAERTGRFEDQVARRGAELGAAGRRVVQCIRADPAAALASSASSLAARASTSDATVIRTVQMLGYSGLAALKQDLAAAIAAPGRPDSPADSMRVTLAELRGAATGAIGSVLDAHEEAVAVLRSARFQDQIGRALPLLHAAGRIAIFGIGPSAPLAQYAARLLGRAGRMPLLLDASGIMLADQMLALRSGDAILALTYGRPYREALGLFGEARGQGIPVVLLTDRAAGPLAAAADATLSVPRGRTGRIALHAATLLALEIIVLALAASDQARTLQQLDRLDRLRAAILGEPRNV